MMLFMYLLYSSSVAIVEGQREYRDEEGCCVENEEWGVLRLEVIR